MGNLSSAKIQFKKIPDTPGFFFTFYKCSNRLNRIIACYGKGGYTIVPAVGDVQEPAIGAQLDVGAGILPLKVSRQGTFFLDNRKGRGRFLIG